MILAELILTDFRNFEGKHSFTFNKKINFIKGKNGSGKSTLSIISLLFLIYGYVDGILSDLPTRSKSKKCSVEGKFIVKGNKYYIKREYPTNITIKENDVLLKFVNNSEKQEYLNKLFGNTNYTKKFRVIDSNIGANFLEEGQIALKKILFSMSDELFNKVRNALSVIKHDREIHNKDTAMISSFYPSEIRLETLEIGIQDLQNRLQKIKSELAPIEQDYIGLTNKKARYSNDLIASKSQKRQISEDKKCYACKRGLDEELKKKMLDEIKNKMDELEISIQKLLPEIDKRKDLVESARRGNDQITDKIYRLKNLMNKLETRIKQKDYKYTNKDVLIVKKAIEELDRLSSYYITESLKILEPIINSVLEKIHFSVKFELNEKGKFAIALQKDNVSYKYKDLSTGQKLILQIGFKLALLIEQNKTGIIIADEGLSSLDEGNLLHVVDIFENLPFQLFMVLHNAPELPESIKVIDLNKEE